MENKFQKLVENGILTEVKNLSDLSAKSFGYDVDNYHGRNKYFELRNSYSNKNYKIFK